jgi:hypothetical protein
LVFRSLVGTNVRAGITAYASSLSGSARLAEFSTDPISTPPIWLRHPSLPFRAYLLGFEVFLRESQAATEMAPYCPPAAFRPLTETPARVRLFLNRLQKFSL